MEILPFLLHLVPLENFAEEYFRYTENEKNVDRVIKVRRGMGNPFHSN
jgi:hypothetical protein